MQQPWVIEHKPKRKERRAAEAIARGADPNAGEGHKYKRDAQREKIFELEKIIEQLRQQLDSAVKVAALLCPNPRQTQ